MRVKINSYYKKRCWEFAEKRINGSKNVYAYRGESNMEKMKQDIFIGLMAEWACYKYLKSKGIEVSKPDMKIYTGRRKSYAADLMNDDLKIHVKSQGVVSAKRYGLSWLGQKTDRLWTSPDPDDYIMFTQVDGNEVEIKGVVKASDIVNNDILAEPKVPRYRDTKIALYWNDVDINLEEKWVL